LARNNFRNRIDRFTDCPRFPLEFPDPRTESAKFNRGIVSAKRFEEAAAVQVLTHLRRHGLAVGLTELGIAAPKYLCEVATAEPHGIVHVVPLHQPANLS